MYDVSPRFLNQLAADRRESLQRSAASANPPLRRVLRTFVARIRPAPVETQTPTTARRRPAC